MNRTRIKQQVFFIGLSLGLVIGLGFLMSLGQILSSFQQGADPASIFRGNELIVPDKDQVKWSQDSFILNNLPTISEQEEISAAYWNAWQAIHRAYAVGDASDLSTYIALPALTPMNDTISPMNLRTYTSSNHILALRFFSDDNSIISFEDEFITTEFIFGVEQEIITRAEVTMSNDNGRWRIRLLKLRYDLPDA